MTRGECRVCGRMFAVTAYGTLRRHVNQDRSGAPRCAGSAAFPLYVVKEVPR